MATAPPVVGVPPIQLHLDQQQQPPPPPPQPPQPQPQPPQAVAPTPAPPPGQQPPSSPRLLCSHGLSQFERVHSVPAGLVHIPSPTTQRRCLYHAAKGGDVEELRAMLASGLNPDAPDQATPMSIIPTA
jgi:hypothetical protein